MEFNLTNILLIIITIAISIIAIKITFTFDINKYLKNRKEDIKNRAKNYCPHAYADVVNDRFIMKSTFISPSGTTDYICERCQLIKYHIDEEDENDRIQDYINDIEKYNKQEKEFKKILKKGNYV
jgi:hypothetical protein